MSKVLQNAKLSTFINLPFAIKTFVLSIFEWSLKTGFTVVIISLRSNYIVLDVVPDFLILL